MFNRADDSKQRQRLVAHSFGGQSHDRQRSALAGFGLIAGIVAKFISGRSERTDPAGILLTIVLGIVGALVGGFLSSQLFGWNLEAFSLPGFAYSDDVGNCNSEYVVVQKPLRPWTPCNFYLQV